MDIEEAINDFCNRFIDEMYATRQLVFEKVIEHQRNCALAIFSTREGKLTGSEGITDLPNDFLGTRLRGSSFFEM